MTDCLSNQKVGEIGSSQRAPAQTMLRKVAESHVEVLQEDGLQVNRRKEVREQGLDQN